ncbi:MAG: MotA/TolQ/ExbB proton channel family protein [Burkholderiales bacterium]|nr:MotA/TolQ/ExbB proton channel family protein [Burkholderiales bacterium]
MINTSAIPAVELTLWTLGTFSIATWTLILVKAWQHIRLGRQNGRFVKRFWDASDLQDAARATEGADGPLTRLAQTGFNALSDGGAAHNLEHNWDRQELLERHLRQQIQKENRALESGLAVLASVGSTAPFVGLFGTVWGIMNALAHIGKLGSASIDVVAAPIGEALVATGIGIAVAVPAVLAYNYFIRRLKLVSADLEDFATDFLNLAQRAAFRFQPVGREGKVTELKAVSATNREAFA